MPWCETANLAERVLGWQCVAPTSVPLRNAIKGVAYAQISVLFRNAIKSYCLQKVVYTYIGLLFLYSAIVRR